MADALKVLGQSAPAATTDTTLYTVPAATTTTVSTLTVCNRATTATSFRVSVRPGGATLANQHYIYFDQAIDGNSTFALTIGMTLSATDVITVYATNANLSFTAFGVEVS